MQRCWFAIFAFACALAFVGGCANFQAAVAYFGSQDGGAVNSVSGSAEGGGRFSVASRGTTLGTLPLSRPDFQIAMQVTLGDSRMRIWTLNTGTTTLSETLMKRVRMDADRFMALRDRLGIGQEELPGILDIYVVPAKSRFEVSSDERNKTLAEMHLRFVFAEPTPQLEEYFSIQLLSTLAHELSHLRAIEGLVHPPNKISDEASAYLQGYCMRWELERKELPAVIDPFSTRDPSYFIGKSPDLVVDEMKSAPPTAIGAAVAQVLIWDETGVKSIPYDDDRHRGQVFELCKRTLRQPVAVKGASGIFGFL